MTRHCWPKTVYAVQLRKWKNYPDGGTDFMWTRYLGKARFQAKKLPLKFRQIDVSKHGKKFVLEGSWK